MSSKDISHSLVSFYQGITGEPGARGAQGRTGETVCNSVLVLKIVW